jgi:hypothetical protein
MKTQKKTRNIPVLHPVRSRTGAADAFCDRRLALGRVAFALGDLMEETGLSAIAARWQLIRLRGKVARVSPRQPFYLIVGPECRRMGAPPPHWWLHEYFGWLGRPYYLALQSAAGAFGSNPQALQVTQVMSDRPCRAIKAGRVHVRFFVKRGIAQTPTRRLAGAAAPLCVSTPEATAYDLIRYATGIGGIERAAETIRPLLPLLRAHELRRVLNAQAKNECPVAQRLGFVLEASGGGDLAKTVRDWLPADKISPVMLAPGRGGRGRDGNSFVARWQVFNNSGELKI